MFETLLALLSPAVVLAGACAVTLAGTWPLSRKLWGPLSLCVLLVASLLLAWTPSILAGQGIDAAMFSGTRPTLVVTDSLSRLFQFLALVLGGLYIGLSLREQENSPHSAEFHGLLLTLIGGLMFVASANDMVILFLGLELISVPSYVLIYMGRKTQRCQESATKYFLLSVMSAAVLLYGLAFMYGLTGSTNLTSIREILQNTYQSSAGGVQASPSKLGVLALALIFAGLGFKLAAVPFHFYAPDVYEGTNAWNAGVLSVVPKAAGMIALIKLLSFTAVGYEGDGQRIALIVALVTMTGGNILALLQTNIRRMLAYSGVAHAGYMLVGLSVGFWDSVNQAYRGDPSFGLPSGIQSSLFYLVAYSFVSVGFFGVLVYLARPGKEVENIEDLTGLYKSHPWLAISSAIFLFSMAGIPPFPGFWGKLAIFGNCLTVRGELSSLIPLPSTMFVVLAVVGMLNAAVAAVYYLRIIALMFLHQPLSAPQPSGGRPAMLVVTLCACLTLWLGFQSQPLFSYLRRIEAPQAAISAQVTPASTTAVAVAQ